MTHKTLALQPCLDRVKSSLIKSKIHMVKEVLVCNSLAIAIYWLHAFWGWNLSKVHGINGHIIRNWRKKIGNFQEVETHTSVAINVQRFKWVQWWGFNAIIQHLQLKPTKLTSDKTHLWITGRGIFKQLTNKRMKFGDDMNLSFETWYCLDVLWTSHSKYP